MASRASACVCADPRQSPVVLGRALRRRTLHGAFEVTPGPETQDDGYMIKRKKELVVSCLLEIESVMHTTIYKFMASYKQKSRNSLPKDSLNS